MRIIYKYPIGVEKTQQIHIKASGKFLFLQDQRGQPCMWVDVPVEDIAPILWRLTTYATGETLPDDPGQYLGSYFVDEGAYVFHVYREK